MATFNVDGKSITEITDASPVVWDTDCGDLFLDAGATTPYVGTSVTSVYLRADNQTKSGTVEAGATVHTINITGVFPIKPYFQVRWRPDKRGVITNVKRDGSRNGRILGDGELIRDKVLVFREVDKDLYDEWEAFFSWHYPHLSFKYVDLVLGDSGLYEFVAPSDVEGDSQCARSWESQLAYVGPVS